MYSYFKRFFHLLLLGAVLFFSCSEETSPPVPVSTKVTFSIDLLEFDAANSRLTNTRIENISTISLTIGSEQQEDIKFEKAVDKPVDNGTALEVEGIELFPGEYYLSELLIKDNEGLVLYATPLKGSTLEKDFSNTLPFYFTISEGTQRIEDIKVLNTLGWIPEDFGLTGIELAFKEGPDCDGGVFEGNVSFTSQDEINEFASLCYTEINGDLRISIFDRPLDLTPLSSLRAIEGTLYIWGAEYLPGNGNTLVSLEGLHNVTQVGVISFKYLHDVQSLEGLRGLKEVELLYMNDVAKVRNLKGLENLEKCRLLRVDDFSSIVNLEGLSALSQLDFLQLTKLPELTSFQGASSLSHIGSLQLFRLDKLTSLAGSFNPVPLEINTLSLNSIPLKDLKGLFSEDLRIKGGLGIVRLDQIESLEGLFFTEEIEVVNISFNDKLRDINGLSGIKTIKNMMEISGNELLKSLDGLESLESISGTAATALKVTNNPELTDLCGVKPLLEKKPDLGVVIGENGFNPLPAQIAGGNCSMN
ncbi:hypothetical protein [Cyclobacterium sp.]|uniref:hypothetical protein n=1 Tax=Cyclobacterium sp. TaxID=1966343 RepID=UPI0019911281|nr:hypothetical protein [Cyclobacterium sp.]MBD3627316.1 hypothetical protein [Cyclobacterium sp.]